MTRYASSILSTPQKEKARTDQVVNQAGGFVFQLTPWQRLQRFLILGAEGGTYYCNEGKLVRDNVASLKTCLAEDGPRVVKTIVEVSDAGRAPKNDPAIFALALAANSDQATRKAVYDALPKVCRTGTHLFQFISDVDRTRGWGSGLRKAVSKWYLERDVRGLALQLSKYQQRNGWSHRDVLRLAHVKTEDPSKNACLRWATHGIDGLSQTIERGAKDAPKTLWAGVVALEHLPPFLEGVEAAKTADKKALLKLIEEHGLPRECIPTEHLKDPEVWEAMLQNGMGITATIRNLGKMTSIGLIAPLSNMTKRVCDLLSDAKVLKRGRVHPMAPLLALGVYAQGHGDKGKLSWKPEQRICDALNDAFYACFAHVEPTGKKHFLAIDVSSSMSSPFGGSRLRVCEAAAAMALVTARTEDQWFITGFTSSRGYGHKGLLTPLAITPKMRLDQAAQEVQKHNFGSTDCALPMIAAAALDIKNVDVFIVYTDNETWAGTCHPFEALKGYRKHCNPDAKLIVNGMTSTGFTIADPSDGGMLDVVGFDAAAPQIMGDFVRGTV